MADNLQITEGSSSKYVRSIEKTATIHTGLTAIDIGSGTTETRLVAGQAAAAASIPVVLASDQASITNISTGADAVAAPTVAINVASFTLLRNRTDNDFDRATVAAADALAVTGVLATAGMMWNGTTYDRPRGDTTNGLDVDVTRVSGNVTVINGGTFATQVDGAALTALQLIDDPVATTGSAVPSKAMFVGGTDGTNARALKTDSSGELQVDVLTLPALAAGSNTIGGVTLVNTGATPKSASGTAASSGNNTLIAAVTSKKIKVVAFSLTTTASTATTCIFQSGAGGTELWRVILLPPTGGMAGANLATALPSWLFETAVTTLLNLNLSAANTIHWSVSYIEEA